MGVVQQEIDGKSVILLDGAIDIVLATELKRLLLEGLAAGAELCVSLETATYLDVTAVQLLWAAEKEAGLSGVPFRVIGPVAETVAAGLMDAGFSPFLESREAA
jgi:anti-anti-sigma regulatory factor